MDGGGTEPHVWLTYGTAGVVVLRIAFESFFREWFETWRERRRRRKVKTRRKRRR